jgi:hypothetical protein
MGACITLVANRYMQPKAKASENEEKFTTMRKLATMKHKDDLMLGKGDFVFELEMRKFKEHYKVTYVVLGSGKYDTLVAASFIICYLKIKI